MSDAIFERIAVALEKLVHLGGAKPAAVVDAPADKPKPGKKAAAAPATTQTATETAPSTAAPGQSVSTAAPSGDLLTQTAETVIDLANNYSRNVAVRILTKYGAQKVSQVKTADLKAVLIEAQAAIEAAKAAKANESLV